MQFRRALVLDRGVGGLTTAHRLLRSDWEVLLTGPSPSRGKLETLSGAGLQAARRLGLPSTGLLTALSCLVKVPTAPDVRSRVPDDCGVTVTFADGTEDWFDLVVDADWGRGDVSLAIFGAELLGDAFDIHHDTAEALRWWNRTMLSHQRRRPLSRRRRGYRVVAADRVRSRG